MVSEEAAHSANATSMGLGAAYAVSIGANSCGSRHICSHPRNRCVSQPGGFEVSVSRLLDYVADAHLPSVPHAASKLAPLLLHSHRWSQCARSSSDRALERRRCTCTASQRRVQIGAAGVSFLEDFDRPSPCNCLGALLPVYTQLVQVAAARQK